MLSERALTIAALCSSSADQKVVWFDVTIDQVLFVNALYPRDL